MTEQENLRYLNPHNPVCWFEIYVKDMPRAISFYESVFQTKLEKLATPNHVEMFSFPKKEDGLGITGALAKIQDMSYTPGNSTIVYFMCIDCAVESQRVIDAGGTICREKFSIGQYGFIALVNDTEGNMIGLYSMQ